MPRSRLLLQPHGFEGSREVAAPFESDDPTVAQGPGVRLLLNDLGSAAATTSTEAHRGDHNLPGVEDLMQFVPGGVEGFGEVPKSASNFGGPTAHSRFHSLGGIHPLDLGRGEVENALQAIAGLSVDALNQLDVLPRHRPPSIPDGL